MIRSKTGSFDSEEFQEFKSDLRRVHEDLISRLYVLQDQISAFTDVQSQQKLEQLKLTKVVQSIHHAVTFGMGMERKDSSEGGHRRASGRLSVNARLRLQSEEDDLLTSSSAVLSDRGRRFTSQCRHGRLCEDEDQSPLDLAISNERSGYSIQHKESARSAMSANSRLERVEEEDNDLGTRRSQRAHLQFTEDPDSMNNTHSRRSLGNVTFRHSLSGRSSTCESESPPGSTHIASEDSVGSVGSVVRGSPSTWFKKNAEGVDFEGLTAYMKEPKAPDRFNKRKGYDNNKIKPSISRRFDLNRLEVAEVIERPKCLVALHPDRPCRTSLDTVALLLLLHDALTVPFLMCWDVPEQEYSWALWATRIFWTLDLPVSLVTGFRNNDQMLELRLIPSMCHYLKTWFFPDLLLVILDWIGFLMKDLRILRAARVRSSFRAFRLVRAFSKMPRAADIWARLVLASDKKEIHVVMSILRVIFVILWINHLVACGWYAIGRWSRPDTGMTWLQNDALEETLYRYSRWYEYWTSLHWAITQMTPGSMEVVPKCSAERLYTVLTLFIGLVVGSTLIAILSSIMTQYRLQLEEKSKKFMHLQIFLSQQKIDALLSMAIKRNVTLRVKDRQILKKKDVEYLKEIPLEMQKELNHGVYMNVISKHKFMNAVSELDSGDAMRGLCNSAIQLLSVNAGEFVFEEGEPGEKMFFVMEGAFQYSPGPQAAEGLFPRTTDRLHLTRGDWCSEPSLWTEWEYLGSLYVRVDSDLLWIRAQEMQKELAAFPHTADVVNAYCIAFHNHMNERGVVQSDLPERLDYADVIFSMTQRQRLSLAAPALDRVKRRAIFKKKQHEQLEKELENGKCLLHMCGGELERTVYVVAVRLYLDGESRFLVKVGESRTETTDFKSMCHLPGTKKREGENLVDSLHRLLSTDLKALSGEIELYLDSGCEQTSTVRESPTYGFRTRYVRSIVHGVLKNDSMFCRMDVPERARQAAGGTRSILDCTQSQSDYDRRQKAMQALSSVGSVFFMMQPRHAPGFDERMSYLSSTNAANLKARFSALSDATMGLDLFGESVSMFAWLTSSQFEDLSQDCATVIMRKWIAEFKDLDQITITPCAAPRRSGIALSQDSVTVGPVAMELTEDGFATSESIAVKSAASTAMTSAGQSSPDEEAKALIVGL